MLSKSFPIITTMLKYFFVYFFVIIFLLQKNIEIARTKIQSCIPAAFICGEHASCPK